MEDVISVYHRPYNPEFPVVCMDEVSKQLIGETRESLPVEPGKPKRIDYEYVRKGTANIFMSVEPLGGKRYTKTTNRRTKTDWAYFIKEIVDQEYPLAKKIVMVLDNLNTHKISSLYETFPPEEAKRIADKLELHFTPKHGSWLNMAEVELSVLSSQCLSTRISSFDKLQKNVVAWNEQRNSKNSKINWQFTNEDARIKLVRLYPEL